MSFVKELLLGCTKSNDVIFCYVELRTNQEFMVNFNVVSPIVLTKEVALKRIEDTLNNDTKIEELERLNCKPSDLLENLYAESEDVISDYFDNSWYSEIFKINGKEVFFDFSSFGQNDTRNELKDLFVSKDLYNYIHELWDNYNLKEITSEQILNLRNLISRYEIKNKEAFLETWLKEILYDKKSPFNIYEKPNHKECRKVG